MSTEKWAEERKAPKSPKETFIQNFQRKIEKHFTPPQNLKINVATYRNAMIQCLLSQLKNVLQNFELFQKSLIVKSNLYRELMIPEKYLRNKQIFSRIQF